MGLTRFEDSKAWQKAMDMAVEVTDAVDACKRFSYVDQIYRSAMSVSSNIAEGFQRRTKPDRKNYLVIAKGSCNETRSLLHFGRRKGILDEKTYGRLLGLVDETGKLIHAVMNSPYL